MKWPWVSRGTLDTMTGGFQFACRELDRAVIELETERRRFDALLAKYHEAVRPTPSIILPPVSPERAESSAISKIIREQSQTPDGRTDNALSRHLRGYARRLKAEGKTDDEIVGLLVQWHTSEPSAA